MTTSDPQAERRDDDSREHRGLGQRLRDAVLGEPADARSDAPGDTAYTDPDRGHVAPDRSPADPAPASSDRVETVRDPGHADPDRGAADVGRAGTDRDYGSYEQAMREHVDGGGVPDPVRDDVRQDGPTRDVAGPDDRGEVGGAPRTAERAGGDQRDFVTSSYDPDRDTGYDPQSAGTAMTGADRSTATDERHDYEPGRDTGYVGEGRDDADRSTGHRDADYDTGRVDTDRVQTGRVDTDADRDSGRTAGMGTAGAVAAGGAAAAGMAASRHRDTDRDTGGTRFSEVDDTATVDPTSTGRSTADGGGATIGSGRDDATDRRAEAVADESGGQRERLVPADRAQDYGSRWDALKGDFVDEPRRAVRKADELVGELLDEMQQLFARQRHDLEQGLDHDRASTEDLRLALRRYRSFFDRLLSL